MAQLNITLNQDEILQLLSSSRDDAFKQLLQDSLNTILQAESTEQLKAEKYERSEERTDSRNGTRERQLTTRLGQIELTVPRHRDVPFRSLIFDNYKRSEAALVSTMAEMVIAGVSTRKVSKVVETLCGTSYSKSMVSEVCKELDGAVNQFRNRPLTDPYPFILIDATYFKVRNDHRTVSKALMVACATNADGKREVIGFDLFDNETNNTWFMFIESLRKRGLHGVKVITSDAHPGILYAIKKIFPEVPWQRCQTHFSRNILDKTPSKYQKGLHTELNEMYNAKDITLARKIRDRIISDYEDIAPEAMECLDAGFESAMTAMVLPNPLRRFVRTSNHIERLNRELKRRSDVITVFPNDDSVIRIMGSVLMDIHEKFGSVNGMGFPIKQLKSIGNYELQLKEIAEEQLKLLAA
ncbi:MAG: IS256 family transposase [Lachnospiraceae bacterium]|nr:IS256 family transposase [Lachnospiraceae bacterium]